MVPLTSGLNQVVNEHLEILRTVKTLQDYENLRQFESSVDFKRFDQKEIKQIIETLDYGTVKDTRDFFKRGLMKTRSKGRNLFQSAVSKTWGYVSGAGAIFTGFYLVHEWSEMNPLFKEEVAPDFKIAGLTLMGVGVAAKTVEIVVRRYF